MMNMNSNMDVVNNLTELYSFNHPSIQDFSLPLSTNEEFSDHHRERPQIPFTFINNCASNNNIPGASSLHVQAPVLNFDSLANFFPHGEDRPFSHGSSNNNNNNIIPSFDSDDFANSSAGILQTSKADVNYSCGGKKRKRNNDKEKEKPKAVVHVRAKRGQATDSHSLAERMRREKINEKLRCLQDLVPGCYKTMGMAVMLDVIINYVRNLQNQIDFLSMKLSAASSFVDFNTSDMDVMGTMHYMHGFEAQGMEKMMGGEGFGLLPQFHNSWLN